MRVVFMGTPDFALPALRALLRCHDVAAVVTQPDKPAGRGKRLRPSPVKQAALEAGVPVLQPAKIREECARLAGLEAQMFVVAAFGQLLPQSVLSLPEYGCVNIHGSLLPKYRGAAPVHHAIMNGETVTGVTIMQMDKGLDTGDMLLKKELSILPEETAGSLLCRMADAGADALIEAMELIARGEARPQKQDDAEASYARAITKQEARIDWSARASDIANVVRAMNPAPGAFAEFDGKPVKIWAAEVVCAKGEGTPGMVTDVLPQKGPVVCAGEGRLALTRLQSQGGKQMSAADYMRGRKILAGQMFC